MVTDAIGDLTQRIDYKPFGEIFRIEGNTTTDYTYNGKELDETGLHYYGARYYDAQLGRFTQPDSIIQAPYNSQSLNRYAYCINNPVNLIDPTGKFFFLVAAIVGAIEEG